MDTSSTVSSFIGFNEAAALKPRKHPLRTLRYGMDGTGFNEAAALKPRKLLVGDAAHLEHPRGFNEAAALKPRKRASLPARRQHRRPA